MNVTNGRIVAFAPNSWHGPWMNRQQLLSRLSSRFFVVYSTGMWYSWDRHRIEWRNARIRGRFDREDGVWLDHPPRLLLRWPRLRRWDRFALARQAGRLRRFSARGGRGPLIGYVFNPLFADDLEALKPDICVYHAYDLFSAMPDWNEELARRERWLLSRADLVLASSSTIADSLRSETDREVVVLPNGADVRLFSSSRDSEPAEPEDIQPIPRPRIGYVGNINRKVDLPLIEHLAKARTDWHFVFVGALGDFDQRTEGALERCKRLPNVHFLGGKAHVRIPRYMAAMDINTMCYRTDSDVWTQGVYPLKLHEYLAVGKPVVSADLPSIRDFAHVVDLAHDARDWEERLENALGGHATGTLESRREVAWQNDWDVRVASLAARLDGLLAQRA